MRITAQRPPWYYRLAIWLLLPIYRLWVRMHKNSLPYYEREYAERFGGGYQRPIAKIDTLATPSSPRQQSSRKIIWCHAVSLGELNTVYPLLRLLLKAGYGLYVTSTTQTGFERARQLFDSEMASGQVVQGFVPADGRAVIERFLRDVKPDLAMFVETELWANTLFCLAKNNLPSVMVNARLTHRSFVRYRKHQALSSSMMANLSLVIAQDDQSATRFLALDLDKHKLVQADSLKWSQTVVGIVTKSPHRQNLWVAGSTHDGEERACLLVHQQLLQHDPEAVLVLVPRHPERFEQVFILCRQMGLTTQRYSDGAMGNSQVYLIDAMGQLKNWYSQAVVAFVGGSLCDVGGHNPIEPIAFGVPIVMGRFSSSCDNLLLPLIQVGAAKQVGDCDDIQGLKEAIADWLFNPKYAKQAGEQGRRLMQQKQSAVDEQYRYLSSLLDTFNG